MPNAKRTPRGRRNAPPRSGKGSGPKSVNLRVDGSRTYHYVTKDTILESIAPIGTIKSRSLEIGKPPTFPTFDRYRVKRVGLCLHPHTYIEFLIRSNAPITSLDTRAELITQTDVVIERNLQGRSKIFWYRPVEPDFIGWQDYPTSGAKFLTGLYLTWNGRNDLISGSDGFLGTIHYDIEYSGPSFV